jgi:hypothetical protein
MPRKGLQVVENLREVAKFREPSPLIRILVVWVQTECE